MGRPHLNGLVGVVVTAADDSLLAEESRRCRVQLDQFKNTVMVLPEQMFPYSMKATPGLEKSGTEKRQVVSIDLPNQTRLSSDVVKDETHAAVKKSETPRRPQSEAPRAMTARRAQPAGEVYAAIQRTRAGRDPVRMRHFGLSFFRDQPPEGHPKSSSALKRRDPAGALSSDDWRVNTRQYTGYTHPNEIPAEMGGHGEEVGPGFGGFLEEGRSEGVRHAMSGQRQGYGQRAKHQLGSRQQSEGVMQSTPGTEAEIITEETLEPELPGWAGKPPQGEKLKRLRAAAQAARIAGLAGRTAPEGAKPDPHGLESDPFGPGGAPDAEAGSNFDEFGFEDHGYDSGEGNKGGSQGVSQGFGQGGDQGGSKGGAGSLNRFRAAADASRLASRKANGEAQGGDDRGGGAGAEGGNPQLRRLRAAATAVRLAAEEKESEQAQSSAIASSIANLVGRPTRGGQAGGENKSDPYGLEETGLPVKLQRLLTQGNISIGAQWASTGYGLDGSLPLDPKLDALILRGEDPAVALRARQESYLLPSSSTWSQNTVDGEVGMASPMTGPRQVLVPKHRTTTPRRRADEEERGRASPDMGPMPLHPKLQKLILSDDLKVPTKSFHLLSSVPPPTKEGTVTKLPVRFAAEPSHRLSPLSELLLEVSSAPDERTPVFLGPNLISTRPLAPLSPLSELLQDDSAVPECALQLDPQFEDLIARARPELDPHIEHFITRAAPLTAVRIPSRAGELTYDEFTPEVTASGGGDDRGGFDSRPGMGQPGYSMGISHPGHDDTGGALSDVSEVGFSEFGGIMEPSGSISGALAAMGYLPSFGGLLGGLSGEPGAGYGELSSVPGGDDHEKLSFGSFGHPVGDAGLAGWVEQGEQRDVYSGDLDFLPSGGRLDVDFSEFGPDLGGDGRDLDQDFHDFQGVLGPTPDFLRSAIDSNVAGGHGYALTPAGLEELSPLDGSLGSLGSLGVSEPGDAGEAIAAGQHARAVITGVVETMAEVMDAVTMGDIDSHSLSGGTTPMSFGGEQW